MGIVRRKQNPPSHLNTFKAVETFILKNGLLDVLKNETQVEVKSVDDEVDDDESSAFSVKKLLELVNLKVMSPIEFINGPGNSVLYGWKTKYSILASLNMKNNTHQSLYRRL